MDLVPNIAFGDLGQSSLAEVVAAGFRAHATGTIAVEQGKGESRLFMRYGAPCGVQLHLEHKPFSFFLIEQGLLEPADSERYLAQSLKTGRRLGDILVSEGILAEEQLYALVTLHHRQSLESLCLLREGKYELRGWERPPEWTEPIVLDPLKAIVTALAADELFDRRREILDRLGDVRLRLADDFRDLASRLSLAPEDHAAFARLREPKPLTDLTNALRREDAEAFIASAALLGLIDAWDPNAVAFTPSLVPTDEEVVDPALFLRPVEATIPPPEAFLRPMELSEEEESIVIDEGELESSQAPELPSALADDAWNAEMSLRLDEALGGSSPTTTMHEAPPQFDGFVLSDAPEGTPASPPPLGRATIIAAGGELAFEAAGEDEPLELDFDRAPRDLREKLAQAALNAPTQREPERSTRPPPARPSAVTPSRPVSSIAPKPTPPPVEEYNPFAVHFRRAAALASSSMDELEDRLERALRGEVTFPPVPGGGPRPAPAPKLVPAPRSSGSMAPVRTESTGSILSDIVDSVGDNAAASVGPLLLDTPAPAHPDDDDELALLAARESAQESAAIDTDGSSTVYDEPVVEEPEVLEEVSSPTSVPASLPPAPPASTLADMELPPSESSGEDIQLTPGPSSSPPQPRPEVTPTPSPAAASRAGDARRRLLQRAFQNVAGTVMNREVSARHNVRAADPVAPRPENADTTLEHDLATRIAELSKQDHFARLSIDKRADTDAIKEAFLGLAKRYHPDRLSAMGQHHLLPQARELFSRIKESYDVLVDPASRARYITELNNKDVNKVKLSPEEAKAAFQRGSHFLRKRDFKNAEAELIRAVDGDPQGEYLAELAWTLLSNPATKDSSRGEIRELVSKALKSGTENDRTFVVAAHVARADNEHEKAEKYFRRAMDKNPKNIEAARELRLIEMRRGTEKKSGSFLDKLRVRPSGTK